MTLTNGSLNNLTGTGTNYSVSVTPTADGPVSLVVNADAAFDIASQGNLTSNLLSVTYDATSPTVLLSPTGGTTTTTPISFSLIFSESVTGLVSSGLLVGNGTIGTISGTGSTYTVLVAPSASGLVTLSLNANAVSDAAGNTNAASSAAEVSFTSIISFVPLANAVGIVGSPLAIPIVADSTAAGATVSLSAITDLVPLGLTLVTTANGRALLSGTVPSTLAVGNYSLSFVAADGFTTTNAGFTLTVVEAIVTPLPVPTVPITGDTGPAQFTTLGLSTPEGIQSMLSALAGKERFQARAFAFDNGVQSFVELPAQPIGGLTVYSGVFLVSRIPLPINLSGSPVPMPAVLILKPGYNLLGIPPIHDGTGIQTTHLWDHFQLQTAEGVPVANPIDLIGVPGGTIDTTRPYLWDGSGYTRVTTLLTGTGYFFKNNSAQSLRLVRTASQVTGTGAVRHLSPSNVSPVRLRAVADRGEPPHPPGFSGSGTANNHAESGSRCGVGSGVGVLGFVLLVLFRLRLRRQPARWQK